MRLGLKLFLATILAVVLVVPAAAAKPGNGNGGGKPSWAGQQGGGQANAGSQAKGKPAWAGQGKAKGQAKKAEQAQRKLDRRAAAEDPAEGDEGELEEPLRDNPAFVCKFERDMMGAEAFADQYGTNENNANAFGKCVSEEAQTRDGAEGDEGSLDEPEAGDACGSAEGDEPVEGEDPAEGEEPVEGEEPTEGDDPAEAECPDDEDADSGEGDAEDGDTDEGSEEGSEEDGGSSADEILTALRLLL